MDHRRNLLFGILAVQLRKISPGKMAEMAAATAAAPEIDLPARLLDEHLISPDDRKLLDSLVEEAIKENGGDPEAAIQWLRGTETYYESLTLAMTSPTETPDPDAVGRAVDAEIVRSLHGLRETPGRYWLKSEHARGGQGRLLIVHDESLGRDVILKELLPVPDPTPESPTPIRRTASLVARFLQEAKITSQLEHPSIVPVYEVGLRPDKTPYYTMKLLKGKTLSAAFRACKELTDRLALMRHFAGICHGIAYAHSRGVIHRDIKPSNIMIGEFGETVVLDWGLAKLLGKPDVQFDAFEKTVTAIKVGFDSEQGKTAPGAVLGTPAYMSPEQARGELDKVDKRSDVYSLGMILYELITGRLPFDQAPVSSVLHKVAHEALRPCTDFQPDAPPELVAICNRCLDRDPAKRYGDAAELAAEIERFSSGALVAAYAYKTREVIVRYYRRHRAMANTVAAFLIALASLGTYSYVNVTVARDREAAAHAAAEDEKYVTQLHLTQSYMRQNNYASARETLWAVNPAQRNWEWGYLLNRCYLDLYSLDDCVAAAYSPDGSRIATLSRNKPIEIWNAEDGSKIAEFGENSKRVFVHEYSPDGTRIAGAGQDNTIRVWDAQSGGTLAELTGHTKNIGAVHFDRTGTRIVSAALDGTVRVWDAASGKLLHTLDVPDATPVSACFGANADTVSYAVARTNHSAPSSLRESQVSVWEPATGRQLFTVPGGHPAVSPDGSLLAVSDGTDLILIGMADGQTRQRISGHTGHIRDIRFSPDGALVVSGSSDGTARMDRTDSPAPVSVMDHGRPVDYVRLSGDGKRVLTASNDGTLKVWDAATGRPANTLYGHASNQLFTVEFSPDGRRIATGSLDQSVKVWDAAQSPGQRAVATYDRPVNAITVSNDGNYAAVLLPNRTMEIRRMADGAVVAAMASYSFRGGFDAVFRPDGKRVAAVLDEFTPMVWDIATQQVQCAFTGHDGPVMCLAFSPDGKWVASGSWDDTARIWDAETGAENVLLAGHADTVRDVAFSEDGKLLATGSEDGTAILWDAATGRRLRTFDTQGGSVLAVSFSRNGGLLATAGERQPARIWETSTGRELHALTGLAGNVDAIAFLAGDSRLAASARGRVVAIWSVQTGSELIAIEDNLRIGGNAFVSSSSGLLAVSNDSGALVELAPAAWSSDGLAQVQSMPERDRVAFLRKANAAAPAPGQSALRIAVATTPDRLQNALRRLAELAATAGASGGAITVDGAVYEALAPLCVLRGDRLAAIDSVAVNSADFAGAVRAAQTMTGGIAMEIARNGAPTQLQIRLVKGTDQSIERAIESKFASEYFESQRRAGPVWRTSTVEFDRSRASELGEPAADGDSLRGMWVGETPQTDTKRYLMGFGLADGDRMLRVNGEAVTSYGIIDRLGETIAARDGKEGTSGPIRLDVERGMFRKLQLALAPK